MQFLHEKNVAGQTLLRLVARGNAIIAEILRLAESIPEPFMLDKKETVQKYGNIVIDFSYLEGREQGKGPDYYERIIESNPKLLALDAEFKETYIKKLKRFYNLFHLVYKYGSEFVQYIADIENANYIQHTLEGILNDENGKQLLCEALHLFGVMLLLLDQKIDGVVRERMVISYLRYMGQNELENYDEVLKLIERTGYSANNPPKKRIPNYPEKYFSRIKLPKSAVKMIIGRIRTDDVYNLIPRYPKPSHRSAALSIQSQMIYVCLYFTPEILHLEEAIMREIVDKHFPDNWVVPFYLGFSVDLTVEWEAYNAARLALANTTQPKQITALVAKQNRKIPKILNQIDLYLQEGTLTEEYILKNRQKLLEWLREANVALRWLILHTRRSTKKFQDTFMKDIDQSQVLLLLMKTSQFEFVLTRLIRSILEGKQDKWEQAKKESTERVKELSEVFSGAKALSRVEKNERLQSWFEKIGTQIEALDFEDKTVSGRKIQHLIRALEEVAAYHQIETNVPVKNFLQETRTFLSKMIRIVNINEDVMVSIELVSELAYARDLVYEYIPLMQERIKQDPRTVMLLRSTFLKLSSILKIPLDRINHFASMGKEAMTKEIINVSEYYSKKLVEFVRTVLQIIPEMMFQKLSDIINIQTNNFQEMPMRVEKEEIEMYSQLNERSMLAKTTFQVTQFTEGILALATTLVGTIEVQPKQLLEEGIRKILVRKMVQHLDETIRFEKHTVEEFEQKLHRLRKVLTGFKRSFNYVQDYLSIYGLKIWQEEFQRIIYFNVEQECNRFLKKVHETRSRYQSKIIPIPVPPPVKNDTINNNFVGRLARELLYMTDVKKTIYLHKLSAWYSREEKEVVGIKTFDLLIESVGVFGIGGLTKFYGFSIVKEIQNLVRKTRELLADKKFKVELVKMIKGTQPVSDIVEKTRIYFDFIQQSSSMLDVTITTLAQIGQKQLLRRQLANILSFKCKLDSNPLYSALEVMNTALLNDIRAHYDHPETKPYPLKDNQLIFEIAKYLENIGANDPFSKIYVTTEPIDDFAFILFLIVLRQLSRFTFEAHLGERPRTKKETIDDTPFVIGLITILKQFHSSNVTEFLTYIGQFLRSTCNEFLDK
eukprot:TRINITY_DN4218_c0_g1_i3.p1 TRINITY_DN4218_c0_g1~~TRINITY_DN4218_c0_g1_i3.p1  ORF type:complete len:1114 (+),score=245.98 TRINITY_DN4218_c0_g1_i3:40-3381(+)